MLTSRERVELSLNHQEPDKVPLDLGSTPVSGVQVNAVYQLWQALKLDEPGTPVKVIEPYQMLSEAKPDLLEALGVDVIGVTPPKNFFGLKNENWKEWTTLDSTPEGTPGGYANASRSLRRAAGSSSTRLNRVTLHG